MLFFFPIIAECDSPILPSQIMILNVARGGLCGNVVGTVLTFQCGKGLFPMGPIASVCTFNSSGRAMWIPDPALVNCTDFVAATGEFLSH